MLFELTSSYRATLAAVAAALIASALSLAGGEAFLALVPGKTLSGGFVWNIFTGAFVEPPLRLLFSAPFALAVGLRVEAVVGTAETAKVVGVAALSSCVAALFLSLGLYMATLSAPVLYSRAGAGFGAVALALSVSLSYLRGRCTLGELFASGLLPSSVAGVAATGGAGEAAAGGGGEGGAKGPSADGARATAAAAAAASMGTLVETLGNIEARLVPIIFFSGNLALDLCPMLLGLAKPVETGPGAVDHLIISVLSMIGGACAAAVFLQRKNVSTVGALWRGLRAMGGLSLLGGTPTGPAGAVGDDGVALVGAGVGLRGGGGGRSGVVVGRGGGSGGGGGAFQGLDVDDLDVGGDALPPSSSASEIGDELDDDEERTLATLNSLGLGSFSGLIAGRSRETATRRSDLALAALEKKLSQMKGKEGFSPKRLVVEKV